MSEVDRIVAEVTGGRRAALARLLTWLERRDPRGREAARRLPRGCPAVVGITGAPGTGKSSLTNRLVAILRHRGDTVAVLAIDPSSPRTGGALLGDRIRMSEHTHDQGVYIRSMATRGQLGGLSAAVPAALRALAAYGFDWLLVETVGVGQVETDIADHADTTIVVVTPGHGDDVQASKAGLLEIADIFAVNKADIGGAEAVAADLNASLDLRQAGGLWRPPVIACSAMNDDGVLEVLEAVNAHRADAAARGELEQIQARRRLWELRHAVDELASERIDRLLGSDGAASLVREVATGRREPSGAAADLLDQLLLEPIRRPARI